MRAIFDKELREDLEERFGRGVWTELAAETSGSRLRPPRIWIHGASVGEVVGISPLVAELDRAFPEYERVVTTTSRTGKAEAIKRNLGRWVSLLPFDYPQAVRRAVRAAAPRLMIVSETEIWPSLFATLEAEGVPILIVNGRISDYSFPRYKRFNWFFRRAFRTLGLCLVQSEVDRERFLALGVLSERVQVTGSTKYDEGERQISPGELDLLAESMGILRSAPCFVAGSVRPGEDQAVIEAFLAARRICPDLQFVIAPRHPERFDAVADLLNARGIAFNRRSTSATSARVVLLDTIGELRKVYGLATVSFVGGTLVDIGGHNPLEPAMFRIPVILGPYTGNVRDAVSQLRAAGALLEVSDGRTLGEMLVRVLGDETLRKSLGEQTYKVWRNNQGASRVVTEAMRQILIPSGAAPGQISSTYYKARQNNWAELLLIISYPLRLLISYPFRAVVSVRNYLYDKGVLPTVTTSIPVISVGNITLGGSGKSPFAGYLAQGLERMGKKPVILSRGYTGTLAGPHQVVKTDEVSEVGDEALMHLKLLGEGVPVVIARRRGLGAEMIVKQNLGDVIILDDGFQHRALGRDLNVLLNDISSRPRRWSLSEDRIFPVGRLRESKEAALKRTDVVVQISREGSLDQLGKSLDSNPVPEYSGKLLPSHFVELKSGLTLDLGEFRDMRGRALTAIENPGAFFRMLENLGLEIVSPRSFRDHHIVTEAEWTSFVGEEDASLPIFVTAKDAVKIGKFVNKAAVYSLILRFEFVSREQERDFWSSIQHSLSLEANPAKDRYAVAGR